MLSCLPSFVRWGFVAVAIAFAGCGNFLTDAATRLSGEICEEAAALRASGAKERTFEHRPLARPEGIRGDYRVEFVGSAGEPAGRRVLLVGESYSGPTRYHTTSHTNCVFVDHDFDVSHHKGEATSITLELRGNEVWITDVK